MPDISDVLNANGGTTLGEVVALSAVDAHLRRATDQVKSLRTKLTEAQADKRAAILEEWIEHSSAHAAIGNGVKRNRDVVMQELGQLLDIPGCRPGVARLIERVEAYVQSGVKLVDAGNANLICVALRDIVSDSYPIPPEMIVPEGYEISSAGPMYKIKHTPEGGEQLEEIAQCPIIPTGILKDLDLGKEMIVISWYLGKWEHIIVPREEATTKSKLELLSGRGLPVSSSSALGVSKFISDVVVANFRTIPRTNMSAHMGWSDDHTSFLWGKTLITAEKLIDYPFDIDKTSPAMWDRSGTYFRAFDGGASQLAAALSSKGTFDKWKEAVKFLDGRADAKSGIIFSLVPVMLSIIDNSATFTIDWGGSTSRGKSTTLLFASSVWAKGSEDGNRFFNSWDTTRINIERTLGILKNLPLLVDDTKKSKKPEDVAKVIYDITSGIGRGRASANGLAVSGEYRTVMMTTGESRVTSFTHDGGAFTRVLQFFGSPLGGTLQGEDVKSLNRSLSGIASNYGHLGPRFVQRLLLNRATWPRLQQHFDELLVKWSECDIAKSPYSSRFAKYMAIFELTSDVCNGFFGIGQFTNPELETFWKSWCKFAEDADQPRAALTYVINRCYMDKAAMWQDTRADRYAPNGGYNGYLPLSPSTHGIYISRQAIEKWLVQAGYDKANCVESWVQQGWLSKNDKDGSTLHPVRVDGNQVSLCHIPGSVIKTVMPPS